MFLKKEYVKYLKTNRKIKECAIRGGTNTQSIYNAIQEKGKEKQGIIPETAKKIAKGLNLILPKEMILVHWALYFYY